MKGTFAVGATLACVVTGCSLRMGDLTAGSSRNVNLQSTMVARAVEGSDCVHQVLFIPVSGSLIPNIEEAADRALATAPDANALTDVAIYGEPLIFILYNRSCIRVRGDAVKISKPEGVTR